MRLLALALIASGVACGAEYRTPAGTRPASTNPQETILPGGRLLTPIGEHTLTGPGPFGLAVNAAGTLAVTADGGPDRFSLTVVDAASSPWNARRWRAPRDKEPEAAEDDWRSVFMGLAFDADGQLHASEGESGRVRLLDPRTNRVIHRYNLNQGGFKDSYTGDLALDAARGLLYVVDQANFRVVVIDTKRRAIAASVRVGRLPFAVALSPDGQRAYVTNIGLFQYSALPGANTKAPRETGIEFPAFGFPSGESERGVTRQTTRGPVRVPPLGDPNLPEANSLCVLDVSEPAKARVVSFVRTGKPLGRGTHGGSSPSGVAATADRVFVSNGHNDSITVVNARTLAVEREVPIRIPGLENLRGVLPIGLAFHAPTGRLLVAEAGINAIGVLDPVAGQVLGHIPTAWFPTRVALAGSHVWVSSAKGRGTGPNATLDGPMVRSFQGERRQGMVSRFTLKELDRLADHTAQVLKNNGFVPAGEAAALPADIQHVVIIVKENRTYDEVFGDIDGAPKLARYGRAVMPNHHAMAERFAISGNFYADSEVSVDGHHWLVGSYPNAWTESSLMAAYGGQKSFRLPTTAPGRLLFTGSNSSVHPEELLEAGALWHHLERHNVPFRNYGEGFELAGGDEGEGLKPTGIRFFTNVPMPDPLYRNTARDYPQYNTNIPDQFRADRFIADVRARFGPGKAELPRLTYIHLPNDHGDKPRPQDGYPADTAYMADNDVALGRIVEFLSGTPWWRRMAILVTEDDAQGGVDHVDSHRTVLLVISPYARRGMISRQNGSFPSLLKTGLRLLGLPPLNLYDATATDLSDCFTDQPDFTPYKLQEVAKEIFDPAKAREPRDPRPSARMDDPAVLREQHRRR